MGLMHKEQFAAMNEHFRYWPFDYFLDVQKEIGVQSIELWAGAPHAIINDEWHSSGGMYRKKVESRGMKIIACCSELTFQRQFFFCSYDPLARDRAMGHYQQCIDFTKETGADILIVNCAGGVLDEDPIRAFYRAVDALKRLGDYADKQNVTLAVETLTPDGGNITHTLQELQELLLKVDHPAVKVCLDTEAMACAGESIQQWFDAFGEDIVHVHLVDGKPAGRVVWGEGLLPLDSFLASLEANHYAGALGQNLGGYWEDPASAAKKNFSAFQPFFK